MRNHIIFLLVTFFITTVIIFSWFSTKTFISNNSEENLSFTNFTRAAQHYSTSWYPSGTGYVNVFEFVRYPFLKFLSFFQLAGFEPYLIQAFSFWIIMNAGLISMYYLLSKGFLLNTSVSWLGSYFYLLNIFSMTQVWKRNIYQGMFPWAYLPLFILLWIKWINEGKIRWLISFAISISIFSHAFAHPGYFFVYMVSAGFFILIKLKDSWKNKVLCMKIVLRSIGAVLLGILVNIWWIYPFIQNSTTGGVVLNGFINGWKANLDSLIGVSQFFGTFDILLLRQKFYFAKDSPLGMEWFWFYSNPLAFLLSIAVLFVSVFGIIYSKTQKYRTYLISLLIVGWFICKGSNFPFGKTFFYLLFSFFPFTAALRNPYEKFGLVFLLPYSVFFSIGLYHLVNKIKLMWRRRVFLCTSVVLFCGIVVYPMWNGDIFPSKNRLSVPAYYLAANDYLNSKFSERSFQIPFTTEAELSKYSWGYLGLDPSENLFDSQNISSPKLPIFNNYFELIPKYLSNDYLPRVLGLLGVDHIILHHDIVYPVLDLNLVKIGDWKEIKKDKEFGQLTLYSLDSSIVKPEIYTSGSLVKFNSTEEALNKISSGEFDTFKKVFTTSDVSFSSDSDNSLINTMFKKTSQNNFRIQVKNATSPFVLILNNTYNDFWIARVNNRIINNHFLVNSFANGWIIDGKGDFAIDVLFKIWPWE